MERKQVLNGDAPSIVLDKLFYYTTNYGSASIRQDGSIDYACIGIQRYSIRIDGDQFLIYYVDHNRRPINGLKSSGYQYFSPFATYQGFVLSEFLNTLLQNKDNHYLINKVKLTIVCLLQSNCNLSKGDLQKIKQIISLLRKPSVSIRKPIMSDRLVNHMASTNSHKVL